MEYKLKKIKTSKTTDKANRGRLRGAQPGCGWASVDGFEVPSDFA